MEYVSQDKRAATLYSIYILSFAAQIGYFCCGCETVSGVECRQSNGELHRCIDRLIKCTYNSVNEHRKNDDTKSKIERNEGIN